MTATRVRDNQSVNAYVCKYGMITGYDCGRIVDKEFKPTWWCSDGTACYWSPTYIKVTPEDPTGSFVEVGDSGGPWFSGTTALGIMIGYATTGETRDAVYMAVDYLSQIGVTVLTD